MKGVIEGFDIFGRDRKVTLRANSGHQVFSSVSNVFLRSLFIQCKIGQIQILSSFLESFEKEHKLFLKQWTQTKRKTNF